ncbi:MAG: glycosyltransferase family 4 protein [Thermoplasmata archaeon]|nr:glycosyltransferase family 4 protein [Thermoplasmata archaeon]
MRLGIVVPTFPTGVASSELWMAKGLVELGHEVIVFSSDRAGARDRGWRQGAPTVTDGDATYRVRRLSTLAFGYAEAAVPLRFSEVFSEPLDACLLAEDYPPLSQLVARGARARAIPYFVTSERYESAGPLLVRSSVRVLDRAVLPRMWRSAAALTFHSRASMRYFAARGAPPDRLHYIPGSTDTGLFTDGPRAAAEAEAGFWPGAPEQVRLLTVARLHPAKGLDILAEAMAQLRTTEATAVSVVRGRGAAEADLRGRVAKLGLGSSLRIDTGSTPVGRMPDLYRSSDVYVQPSLTEPFGMAVLEAMACGRPIVASATGGLADLVQDGENGFLVPPGDASALAAALNRLVADPRLREQMGRASRRRAESQFGIRPVAQSYVDLLTAALPRAG